MKIFLKKIWKKLLAAIILLVLIIIVAGGGNKGEGITKYTVVKGDVVKNLVLGGVVEPVEGAEMAFPAGGLVDQVYKKAGDYVFAGEKIIELDNGSLRADLMSAQANLDLEIAEGKVTNAEDNTSVKNAYSKLLSDGLIAYSKAKNETNAAPEVSGSYTKGKEGTYRIEVEYSATSGSSRKFHFSGLDIGDTNIVYYQAVPIGNSGLYLKFEEDEVSIGDEWFVNIPNESGENYVENLNAYKSALASSEGGSGAAVSEEITDAKIKQARAEVLGIQAKINERTIRAPFSGVVSKIDIKKGEIAESGVIVTGVISNDAYEIVVEVPEVDIVNLSPNSAASITLDAYGDESVFEGTLTNIDPAETDVEGVSVYRANVSFNQADGKIRSGMTANLSILKDKREGVMKATARFIETDETGEFVMVEAEEVQNKVYITTGLEGSDGNVEVLTGLKEGDVLVGAFEK